LPITGLAEASARPENFIGVHFFSPVDRMPLVELILGKKTSPEALAKAMDYVQAIKKTPIVVNDRRGFYTSRCFSTYADEGMQMLIEGYKPALIENIGRQTGMPRGPLEISDDVALDLAFKISEATRKETGQPARPVDELLRKLVVDLGRLGRKNGKGFYDYPADGKKLIWPGLKDLATPKILEAAPPLIAELKTRLLYRQALEAARCVEESVVTDPRDGDVGAILGWGFAPYTGGPLSLIDTVGAKAFVATCDAFAKRLGERWTPCTLLREMAEKGETFYGRFGEKKAA
jgi:3-hydroxyacyl-CoA dehydrogenase/enoyl-CoA hydratase/3-hydroxybutyryl-CoA epimerase